MKAKARFDNTAGALFPNQFVNVRLTLRTIDALVVPVTSVRTGPGGPYVYVIGEDRVVKMRNVKRGEATVEVMAITEGLAEGEKVVTEGGDRLSDGSRVQLQGDAPRTPGAGGGSAVGVVPAAARAVRRPQASPPARRARLPRQQRPAAIARRAVSAPSGPPPASNALPPARIDAAQHQQPPNRRAAPAHARFGQGRPREARAAPAVPAAARQGRPAGARALAAHGPAAA